VQCRADRIEITEVTHDDVSTGAGDVLRAPIIAVDERADMMPAFEQESRQVRSGRAGRSGDEEDAVI
jgi:hypothetical protein